MKNRNRRWAFLLTGAMLTAQFSVPAYAEENLIEIAEDQILEIEEEVQSEIPQEIYPEEEFTDEDLIIEDVPEDLAPENLAPEDLAESNLLLDGEEEVQFEEEQTTEYGASVTATVNTAEELKAAWDAGDAQTNKNVVINVTQNICFADNDWLYAKQGVTYTIDAGKTDGSRYTISKLRLYADENGTDMPNVTVNADLVSTDGETAVDIQDKIKVQINGNITSDAAGIFVTKGADVTVTGDVITLAENGFALKATEGSKVSVEGSVSSSNSPYGICASGSDTQVLVEGDVTVALQKERIAMPEVFGMIDASEGAAVTVGRNVIGENGSGRNGIQATGINTTVTVQGDVLQGNIVSRSAMVSVEGNVDASGWRNYYGLCASGKNPDTVGKIYVGGNMISTQAAVRLLDYGNIEIGGDINSSWEVIKIDGSGEVTVGGNAIGDGIYDTFYKGEEQLSERDVRIQIDGYMYAKNYAFGSRYGVYPSDGIRLNVTIGGCVRTDGGMYCTDDWNEDASCTFENFKDTVTWGEHDYHIADQNETSHIWECSVCGGQKEEAHYGGTATCTEGPECEVCGEEYEPELGHKLTKIPKKEATCTEDGHEEYWKCEVCGLLFDDEDGEDEIELEDTVIEATGHDYEIADQNETSHIWECSVCGDQKEETHYGGTATCTEGPECEVCGEEYEPELGHKLTKIPKKEATCTEDGHEEYWKCEVCGLLFDDEDGEDEIELEDTVIEATGHEVTEVKNAKKATYSADGYTGDTYCASCGVKLKDGSVIPALTETAGQLQKNNNAINAKLKGAWSEKSIKVTWGKVSRADGYDIYAERCGVTLNSRKLCVSVHKGSATSVKINKISGKKLSSGASYKFRVRAWRMVNNKKKYIATSLVIHVAGKNSKAYTNVKKLTAEKTSYTLKKGRSVQISVKAEKQSGSKKLLSASHTSRLRYWSTNTQVAKVNAKGKVTAKGKGSCYIYVISACGTKTKVKITVK